MRHLIVFSQTDLGQCSAARFTYKGNVDDLFAWALVFAPVVIGCAVGWVLFRWTNK
jgi:hypothetical protein